MKIEFTIPHAPIAQPRHRAQLVILNKKQTLNMPVWKALKLRQIYTHMHVPESEELLGFKRAASYAAKKAYWDDPFDCPVIVNAVFVFPRHKAKIWKTKPMPRYPHTVKPDRDNTDKAMLDAFSGILYTDDARVFMGTIEKWHAAGHEEPHVEVSVEMVEV